MSRARAGVLPEAEATWDVARVLAATKAAAQLEALFWRVEANVLMDVAKYDFTYKRTKTKYQNIPINKFCKF